MPSIVGVTKCPVGIAHTYMAAEKIKKAGEAAGYSVKVETQGASGTEDTLTQAEIDAADFVILAIDVEIDGMDRFVGKKVLFSNTPSAIKNSAALIEDARTAQVYAAGNAQTVPDADAPKRKEQNPAVKQLLNGVSHMIPFVVVGGLFIALSIALGGHASCC